MSDPLPPEIVAAIEKALSDLEASVPGVSRDAQVRGEVEAAVSAAVSSLERRVTDVMEAEMGDLRSMTESETRARTMGNAPDAAIWWTAAAFAAGEATRRDINVIQLAEATRRALEREDPAAVTESRSPARRRRRS
jgi:hypothetical protein